MTWIQIVVLCVTFSVLQGYPTDGSIEEPGLGIFLEDILMNSVYGKCDGTEEDGNALKLLNDRVHNLVENIIQSLSEENHGIEISDQSKFMDLYDVPGLLDLLAVKMGESISNLAHYCGWSDMEDIGTRSIWGVVSRAVLRLLKPKPAPKPPNVAPKPPTKPQPKATKAPVTTKKPPTTTRKPQTTTKPPKTTPEPENKKTKLKEKALETAKGVAENVVADLMAEGVKEVVGVIVDQVSPNDESDENYITPETEITSIEQFNSDVDQANDESDANVITPESDITTIEQSKSDVEQENVIID